MEEPGKENASVKHEAAEENKYKQLGKKHEVYAT